MNALTVRKYSGWKYPAHREAISNGWICNSSMGYLNCYNLHDLILLENAYAAIKPTKEILNKVLDIIDRNIRSNNARIKNDALLLRYSENKLDDIA